MESLYNSLKESLLGDFDDIESSIDPRKDIEEFIKNNYATKGRIKISKNPNEDGMYEVSCINAVVKNQNITSLTNNSFVWVYIRKDFKCSWCENLTSLEGAPKKVGGNFTCSYCKSLTSLKDCPSIVAGKEFFCSYCESLTSLKGAPKEFRGCFFCTHCHSLTSLEGAPKKVDKFYCQNCDSLISLEGAPEIVNYSFNCISCHSLTSLKGAPKEVQTFYCCDCERMFTKNEIEKYINKVTYIYNNIK